MKRGRLVLGASCIAAGLLITASVARIPARMIYNPSASAPKGFYWIEHKVAFQRGEFVAALPPEKAQILASERGYLPEAIPVLKTIYGVSGDLICIENGGVIVNEMRLAEVLERDSVGRQMPVQNGCYRLQEGEYFLLSTKIPNSFDSRYFGPVGEDRILGVATPLAVFAKRK